MFPYPETFLGKVSGYGKKFPPMESFEKGGFAGDNPVSG
jgi:hypothetical protein